MCELLDKQFDYVITLHSVVLPF